MATKTGYFLKLQKLNKGKVINITERFMEIMTDQGRFMAVPKYPGPYSQAEWNQERGKIQQAQAVYEQQMAKLQQLTNEFAEYVARNDTVLVYGYDENNMTKRIYPEDDKIYHYFMFGLKNDGGMHAAICRKFGDNKAMTKVANTYLRMYV